MTNQHKPDDQTDLQKGIGQDFDKLAAQDDKPKKEKSKYTEDVNDPAYVEPRLRPGWTPDQPG